MSGLGRLGPTLRHPRPALSGAECFLLTWSDRVKAPRTLGVVAVGGESLRLASNAPGRPGVRRSFRFGDAGEGHGRGVAPSLLVPVFWLRGARAGGGSARVGLELSQRAGHLFCRS